MPSNFFGRTYELKELSRLLKKRSASLAVIQGRRRIGKSRLVEEFAKGHTFFHFSGLPPTDDTSKQSQRNEFALQLSRETGLPEIIANDWTKLFDLLAEKVSTGRVIILFDEISWMGSKDPDFLGKLKNAWDIRFKKNPELILILCGSVSSWIEKNILASTGFVGRISLRLTVEELLLKECNGFWLQNSHNISPFEKLKVLSVTGGVPRYLEEIDPATSAEKNIRRLCFTKNGLLVNEFEDIFSDIFSKRTPIYKKIVTFLAKGPLETKDISNALHIEQTGAMSGYLEDLEKSGFIQRDYTWHITSGKVSRLSHYRLSDNYIRFYLKYIEKERLKINNNEYSFRSFASLPNWHAIKGLQFENLVLRNRQYIKDTLNLSHDDIVSNNPFFQRPTTRVPGCQIDYMIQTMFNELYICEIKFSSKPITMSVTKEVQQKIDRLVRPRGFSVKPVLIHGNEVSESVIHSSFFAHIIDIGNLLKN